MNSFLHSLQRSIWIALIVIVVGILSVVSLRVFGYYIDEPGWYVAEQLVAKGKGVKNCRKILLSPLAIFGPPLGERRMDCIHEYAKLTKDPSACELLMPSSYGLSCVGAASESPICGINSGFEVQWHEGEEAEIQRSSLKDCQQKNGRTKKGDQCCVVASISGIRGFNDCSLLENDPPLFDNCLTQLAFKNHDPTSCESIQDPRIKSGCIVNATALKKDPSICLGCTPPVESVDDLK